MQKLVIILICLLMFGSLFAGDMASFLNLGFSDDSRYFMFGQYGLKESDSRPYADSFIVDVSNNSFVKNGVYSEIYPNALQPSQKGLGAVISLVKKNAMKIDRYSINHLNSGRLLYILINGAVPEKELNFRDFSTSNQYKVVLEQERTSVSSSSFHIKLTLTSASGSVKNYIVGSPSFSRNGVLSYKIRQILISPDNKSLVFIVEKEEKDTDGVNIRYMVETVSLK